MAARAELKAKSTLDSTAFDRGLAKMGQKAKSLATGELAQLGKAVAGLFAFAAIANTAKSMSNLADEVQKTSVSLGITTDQVQALQYGARELGLPFDGVTAAILKMRDAQEEVATTGNKTMIAAFERLGITAEQVLGSTTAELFDKVLAGAKKSATSVKDLNDIMGRGGAQTIKPFADEVESVNQLVAAAKEANQIISQGTLINVDRIADAATRLQIASTVEGTKTGLLSTKAGEALARKKEAAILEQQKFEAEGRLAASKKLADKAMAKKEKKLDKAVDKMDNFDRSPVGGSMHQFADQLQRMGAGLGSLNTSPFAEAQKARMIAEKTKEIMEDSATTQKTIAENTAALKEG